MYAVGNKMQDKDLHPRWSSNLTSVVACLRLHSHTESHRYTGMHTGTGTYTCT